MRHLVLVAILALSGCGALATSSAVARDDGPSAEDPKAIKGSFGAQLMVVRVGLGVTEEDLAELAPEVCAYDVIEMEEGLQGPPWYPVVVLFQQVLRREARDQADARLAEFIDPVLGLTLTPEEIRTDEVLASLNSLRALATDLEDLADAEREMWDRRIRGAHPELGHPWRPYPCPEDQP